MLLTGGSMMRRTTAVLLALTTVLLLSAAGSAAPTGVEPGPYAGVLDPGASAVHHFQNAPDGAICIQITQPYAVRLAHAPTEATVELRVGPHVTTSAGGLASLVFERGVCTEFDIHVTVLEAGTPVAYALDVKGGLASGAVCDGCIAVGDVIA